MSQTKNLFRSVRDMIVPESVFDFWSQEFGLLVRRQVSVARVERVVKESESAVSLWLKPNANFNGVMPGQHLNLAIEIDGRRYHRSYSVSQVHGRQFRVTARRVPNGIVSNFLNDCARAGLLVHLGEAYGEVNLQHFEQKPALFLAGGIGITPIISMLESWSSSVRTHPVDLLYWGKSERELAFVQRLKNLARHNDWFRLHIIETEFLERNEDGTPKLIAESSAWFADIREKISRSDVFVCGNDGFVNQLKERLQPLANSFRFESFTPAFAMATPGAPIQVNLLKQRKTVTIPSGINLLQALERAGVHIASGCRRGTCNTCSCKKVSGIVRDQKNQRLHVDDEASFKPCIHAAESDITLEL